MPEPSDTPKRKSKSKGPGTWVLALFGLPFAAAGLGLLLLSVLPTLVDWSTMQGWQPVQATLASAETVASRGSKSTTYSVKAEYQYRVAGQEYTGRRVAIGSGSDNVGEFQKELGTRLEEAQRSGTPVQAWVNPDNPAEAVLDRSLRLGMLAFKLVFALVFGGAGLGIMLFAWRIRSVLSSDERVAGRALEARPWESRAEWKDNRIRARRRIGRWVLWVLALVWNLVAFPMAAMVVPRTLERGNPLLAGALLMFPLVGLALLVWAVRAMLHARRYGDLRLTLDPFPGSIGGHFGASLEVPVPYEAGLRFLATLQCEEHTRTRSGNKTTYSSRTLWQVRGLAQVEPQAEGVRAAFRFDLPAHLPASEEPGSEYHEWRVEVRSLPGSTGDNAAPGFVQSFDVPVYLTNQKSVWLQHDAAQHPQLGEVAKTEGEDVSDVEQVPGGVRLYFPYGRRWKTMLALLVFGAVFAGAGTLLWNSEAPLLFSVLFGGIGSLVVLSALYGLSNSLDVHLDRQGLRTERRLLGLVSFKSGASASEIGHLELKESYSTETGGQKETYYRLQAVLTSGKSITVADSLRGRAAAQQLLSSLCRQTGYTKGSTPG
ncbi:DUF3592 domain-containing protein [Acidovorax sp.]|uniref:DUF3592 domain-containing protein n=1 Tax=Acidovorax sp. TaxID=1872122 RepID=UPI003D07C0F6